MLPGLLQVDAIAGTVESHLALFAAALPTDAAMDGRTEAFFLALFADDTTHRQASESIMTSRRAKGHRGRIAGHFDLGFSQKRCGMQKGVWRQPPGELLTARVAVQRTPRSKDLGNGGDNSDVERPKKESSRESTARMGDFGNFGRESQRFLRVFQHHT
jgi:hypothetical protein